jgi:phage shock protein A
MRRNTSALLEDKDAIPALLDGMPDFDSLFERQTPAQIDAILDEQLASDGSAESRSSETAKYGSADNSVDKAFSELMTGK